MVSYIYLLNWQFRKDDQKETLGFDCTLDHDEAPGTGKLVKSRGNPEAFAGLLGIW